MMKNCLARQFSSLKFGRDSFANQVIPWYFLFKKLDPPLIIVLCARGNLSSVVIIKK